MSTTLCANTRIAFQPLSAEQKRTSCNDQCVCLSACTKMHTCQLQSRPQRASRVWRSGALAILCFIPLKHLSKRRWQASAHLVCVSQSMLVSWMQSNSLSVWLCMKSKGKLFIQITSFRKMVWSSVCVLMKTFLCLKYSESFAPPPLKHCRPILSQISPTNNKRGEKETEGNCFSAETFPLPRLC